MRIAHSLILVGVGLLAVLSGHYVLADWRNRLAYEAADLRVDLSTVGTYEGDFQQRYSPSHGKQYRFVVEPPFGSRQQMIEALAGLKASLKISKANGDVVMARELIREDFQQRLGGGCMWFAPLDPATPGVFFRASDTDWKPCTLVLQVLQPASGFSGREQRLVTKNVFCRNYSVELVFAWLELGVGVFLIVCGAIVVPIVSRAPTSEPGSAPGIVRRPLGCVFVLLGGLTLALAVPTAVLSLVSGALGETAGSAVWLLAGTALLFVGLSLRNPSRAILSTLSEARASWERSELDSILASCAGLVPAERPEDLYHFGDYSTSQLIDVFRHIDREKYASRFSALLWVLNERRDGLAARAEE